MNTPNIPAIETIYRGNRFRSRTEAKWAVFFDLVGEPYEYEPQGVALSTGPYLPDFWLPRGGVWFEVKGTWEAIGPIDKYAELCRVSGHMVIVAAGQPQPGFKMVLISPTVRGPPEMDITIVHQEAHVVAYPVQFCRKASDLAVYCELPGFFRGGGIVGIALKGGPGPGEITPVDDLLASAGMARFEHGERGARR